MVGGVSPGLSGIFSSSSATPIMGITAIFDAEEANQQIARHEERIRQLEEAHQRLADQVQDTAHRNESNSSRSTQGIIGQLRKWRWEIITAIFFVRMLAQATREAFQTMAEAAESAAEREGIRALARSYEVNLGGIAAQLREVAGGTLSVRESMAAVQAGILQDQGQFVNAYADLWQAARVAAVTSGGEVVEHFAAMVEALATGDAAVLDSSTNIYQAEIAVLKYAQALGTTVDELDPMVRAQVILNTVMETTDDLLAHGADSALAQAAGFDTLAAKWEDFRNVAGVVGKELLAVSGIIDSLNRLLTTLTQISIVAGAAVAGVAGAIGLERQIGGPGRGGARITLDMERGWESARRVFEEGLNALGMFTDEVDATGRSYERLYKTSTKSLEPIVDHLMRRQELIADHNRRVDRIELQHSNKLEDLAFQHEITLDRIRRKAELDEDKAWRSYSRKLINAWEDYHLKQEQALEDHLLKLQHMRERYHLESLQRERMYQYERGLLVAYGDVLAIEDLDARYALETRAREENEMQKEREERDDFRLSSDQREEKYELDLKQMRRAYEDQLEEIRIQMEEQLREEAIRLEEARRIAQRDFEQRLEEERLQHAQELEEWSMHWANIARQVEVSSAQIQEIILEYFGPTSVAYQTIADFLDRFAEMEHARNVVTRVVPRAAEGGTEVHTYGPWGEDYVPRTRSYPHQFGGEGVAYRPTLISAGEGHTPERWSVQPLAAANSTLVLSWAGGPIPVEGTGGIAGANLQGLGDAIVRGLALQLGTRISNYRR